MLIKKADNVRLFCFYTPPILAKSLILEKIFKCSKIKQPFYSSKMARYS
ncbi:MAG: hypothetical protein RLZ93_50, partial [Bacteroidota bacterium]